MLPRLVHPYLKEGESSKSFESFHLAGMSFLGKIDFSNLLALPWNNAREEPSRKPIVNFLMTQCHAFKDFKFTSNHASAEGKGGLTLMNCVLKSVSTF